MNHQQLVYIVAVDTYRHFVTAAEKCFVTQATLSMMIKKLEEELDVKIFDRSKQPVVPTETGKLIIAQARVVLHDTERMKEIVQEEKGQLSGELSIGIIPTLAPYIIPLFVNGFMQKYPDVKLRISEIPTDSIINKLQQYSLDVGLLATPLNNTALVEQPLFYEPFVVYASRQEKLLKKKYLLADDIDINRLWLLEEGHCLRSQVVNLCELKHREKALHQLDFEAGSIETLKKIVDLNQGITILPELALNDITAAQKENIRYFKAPQPVREISLVTFRHYVKKKLVDALKEQILLNIPAAMRTAEKKERILI
jgi:LysR family transcriptional regulator, hydrogen peroxide-inducible genes activator